jgi:hypothetical protein
MPLINPEGFALGTLCVWDSEPKELDLEQQECILRLARQVLAHLECRRRNLTLAEERTELQSTAAAAQERAEGVLRNVFPNKIAASVIAG